MPEEIIPPAGPVTEDQIYGDPKMWYQSTELWSAIVAIVFFILEGIGVIQISVPGEVQASIVTLWMALMRGFRKASPIAWTKAHLARLNAAV